MLTGSFPHLLQGGTLRLLTHFLVHSDRKLPFDALTAHTHLGHDPLQRELARWEDVGLITRSEHDGRVYYEPVRDHPSWNAAQMLVRQHADPADVLREALSDVEGIKAAFIFGSTARGDARRDSDIDVFILEENMLLASIGRAILTAHALLDRPIDIKRYTPATLTRKLRRDGGFVRDVLSGPKIWLIGSENALQVA